ncbi:MAG: hypothetical protein IKM43_02240 [Clostridia bacterium]|nr:hypothetical protein [Clostridia bacterium]
MTEKELNEYSIFTLRELARKTGVATPTSKKKAQLIHEILEINAGKRAPQASTKQGRPPKYFGYSFDILNTTPTFDNTMSLNQNKTFSYDDVKTGAGFVEKLNQNTSYIWCIKECTTCYYTPTILLNNYNIKSGDYVTFEFNNVNNQLVVKDIFNINGCPIKKFNKERTNYYAIKPVAPNKKINIDNLDIKFGENAYFYGTNNNENTQNIINILNKCNATKKIYINVTIAEKNKLFLDDLQDAEKFVANITDTPDTARRIVNIATEYAKRLMENGEHVAIAVDDAISVASVDDEILTNTKNLISVAKASSNGSITLFAIFANNKTIDLIEKLADKRYKIENDKMFLI